MIRRTAKGMFIAAQSAFDPRATAGPSLTSKELPKCETHVLSTSTEDRSNRSCRGHDCC